MYSSSTQLALLLLTCLVGLALARPISSEDLSIITKRTRDPRQLRSTLTHTQKFNRRRVKDIYESEVDGVSSQQLAKQNMKNKNVAANPSVNYKKTSKEINASFGKEREAAEMPTKSSKISKQGKVITKADTNKPNDPAYSYPVASGAPDAAGKWGHHDESNDEDDHKPYNAPFDSDAETGIEYIKNYKFHFEDTEPLTDGTEVLREQNQEGLAEEAQERAEDEEELRIATLRAQIAQRVREAVGGLL